MTTETDVLIIETHQAVQALKAASEATKELEKKQKDLADFMKSDLQNAFFSAQAQYDILKNGARLLISTIADSVGAFNESAMVSMRLDAALKNAGNTSVAFRQRLDAQATAMERLTGIQDEEILTLHTLGLALGLAPSQLERVTKAAIGLSVTTGQSATFAMRLLSRASAENNDELKRLGITVNDGTNGLSGFEAALTAVEGRVNGATDALPPQIKALNELKGSWNSFSESLGEFVIKMGVGAGQAGGGYLVSALDGWSEALKRMADKSIWSTLLTGTNIVLGLGQASMSLGTQTKNLTDSWQEFTELFTKEGVDLKKGLEGLGAPDDEFDGKLKGTKTDTTAAHAAKMKAARDKREAEELRQHKAHIKARIEMYAEAVRVEDARRAESNAQAEKDRNSEHEVMQAERDFINSFGLSAAEEKLQIEQDYQKRKLLIIDQANEHEKQKLVEVTDFAKSIGKEAVQFAAGLLREELTAHTRYSQAYKEQIIKQQTVGMAKAEADKKVHDLEIGWAQEGEAALAQKTAAILADIAVQALVKAAFETAEGIAAAASVYGSAKAPGHFYAAAAYAGIAGLTGGAAIGISASRGMTKEEKSSLESNSRANDAATKREAEQGAQRRSGVGNQTNIYYMGITGQTEAQQGAELERIRGMYESTKTGG